jgi:hypothetical protein
MCHAGQDGVERGRRKNPVPTGSVCTWSPEPPEVCLRLPVSLKNGRSILCADARDSPVVSSEISMVMAQIAQKSELILPKAIFSR